MSIALPPPPDGASAATARLHLRYEDITQDGRLVLEALPNALGAAIWSAQLARDPLARACFAQGIVPILTRFVMEGTPGPFSASVPVSASGTFRIARAIGPGGETQKLLLEMWADVSGPVGRTYDPQPERAGETALAGRIYGEHVFTRLFAPPEERKVLTLDVPGGEARVTGSVPSRPLGRIAELPAAARPLDDAMVVDPVTTCFGVVHTDSNQHVNSLVYLRLFEEAALRRLTALGRSAVVLSRAMEIGYRKPCFAGDRVRVALRAFETPDGRVGVAGVMLSEADAATPERLTAAKPCTYVKMLFE